MCDFLLIYVASDLVGVSVRELTAYLDSKNINTKLLFLAKEYWEEISEKEMESIIKFARGARLIGLSFFSNHLNMARFVTEQIRSKLDTPVILGGVHPTIRPRQCLLFAKYVCVGEGENLIVKIFEINQGQQKISLQHDIPGLWRNENGEIIERGFSEYLADLDDLPAQNLFSEKASVIRNGEVTTIPKQILKNYLRGRVSILASRGCPFNCTFCINNFLNSNSGSPKIRRKSVKHLVDEISAYLKEWPEINLVRFCDDAFISLPMPWMVEFCDIYKKQIGVPIDVAGVNPNHLREDKLALLVGACLKTLRMGIQAGSESSRLDYKRRETNKSILELIKTLSRYDLKVRLDFILDNPFEKLTDQIKSLFFINSIPLHCKLNFFSLTFYPGTEIYDRAVNEGLINDEEEYLSTHESKQLKLTYINALNFYLSLRRRPNIILKLLTSKFIFHSPHAQIFRTYFVKKYPSPEIRYLTINTDRPSNN